MAKLTLSTITSGYGSVAALNANFDAIETALENTLSRDGTSPNTMSDDLDMNSNHILNLPAPASNTEPVRLVDLSDSDATGAASATLRAELLASSGSSLVGFLQAGDDATSRTVQAKLRDCVTVKDFGAVGDGTTDDTAAIQAALDSGKPIWDSGESTYSVTSALVQAANVPLRIYGKLRLRPDDAFTCLANTSAQTASTTLSASQRQGRVTITVTSATGMAVGDIIILTSDELWPYNNTSTIYKGETNRITGISGTTITLAIPLFCNYVLPTETVTVQTYTPQVADIDGLDIEYPAYETVAVALNLQTVADGVLRNVRSKWAGSVGINLGSCFGVEVASPILVQNYSSGLGYGVLLSATTNCIVNGGTAYGHRHAVDTGGGIPAHMCGVTGMTIVGIPGTGSCIGTHGSANMMHFTNNILSYGNHTFDIRSPNTLIANNTAYAPGTGGSFAVFTDAPGFTIVGNRLAKRGNNTLSPGLSDTGMYAFVTIQGTSDAVVWDTLSSAKNKISGNTSETTTTFLRLATGLATAKNLVVTDNDVTIENSSSGNSVSFIEAVTANTPQHASCEVSGNRIRKTNGTYTEFSNIAFDTWTPVLTFATAGDLAVTYTTQVGKFHRRGSRVIVSFDIVTSAFTHTTAAGGLRISGIPWTAANVTGAYFRGTLTWQGITKANYTQITPTISPAGTVIYFECSGSAQNVAAVDAADCPTGGTVHLRGQIEYTIADLTGFS